MFYLSLSYFWKHRTLLADPLMKKLIVRWINLNALTAANLSSVAHSKVPAFSFLSTRRYSFNSFVFFFASGLSQLPNFRQLQMFRLRYRTFALTHRRFNLILLPLLGHNSLPMTMHLSTTRLSITKLPNKLNFRRPSKVFFFKRNLHHARIKLSRLTPYDHSLKFPIKLVRNSLTTSRLWTQSHFKLEKSRYTQNTLPFLFLSATLETKNTYISNWIHEFKRKVTRFMKLDFKKTVIQYNLKPLYTRDLWLLGNRTPHHLINNVWGYNFFGFSAAKPYLLNNTSTLNSSFWATDKRKSYLYRFRSRRMLTLWVSKVTQRTLTPVRREFNSLYYRKPLRYQHRLTRLVLKYYRFRVLEFVNTLEFSFINVVMRSRFIVLRSVALDFIARRWFLVNSAVITDPSYIIAPLDVLQLTPSLLWIFFYKWLLLRVGEYFSRFFYYLRKWRIRANRPYPKQSSFRIPEWVRKKLFYRETTPIFFEIDFLTFSCINLFNPLIHTSNYHYLSINTYAPATIRPLNWKSLT